MRHYDFNLLALLVAKIKQDGFTGSLIGHSRLERVELYFFKGRLQHATDGFNEGDNVLYDVLGWSEGYFQVMSGPTAGRISLDDDQVATFEDTLRLLQSKGIFATSVPAVSPPAPIVADPQFVPATVLSAQPPSINEVNLLLPPGERQNQLEELLKNLCVQDQLDLLTRTAFSGYVYYRLNDQAARRGDFGLVLLDGNRLTDVIYQTGGANQRRTGAAALEMLANQTGPIEVYRVEARLLRSYRALLNQTQPPAQTPATRASLANTLLQMEYSHSDGVVSLYLDALKLHYFFFFEDGQRLGVYGSDHHSGRLKPLVAPLALPTNDFEAFMTVLTAHPNTTQPIQRVATEVVRPELNQSQLPISQMPSLALVGYASSDQSYQLDEQNPFDF